jgi:hypothetical protein
VPAGQERDAISTRRDDSSRLEKVLVAEGAPTTSPTEIGVLNHIVRRIGAHEAPADPNEALASLREPRVEFADLIDARSRNWARLRQEALHGVHVYRETVGDAQTLQGLVDSRASTPDRRPRAALISSQMLVPGALALKMPVTIVLAEFWRA